MGSKDAKVLLKNVPNAYIVKSMMFTVIFVERIYNPFLVSFVKAPQPEVKSAVDAHQSFLQVNCLPIRDDTTLQQSVLCQLPFFYQEPLKRV